MKAEEYNLIKKDLLIKIGKKVLYGKDCVRLAEQIHEKTNRQISSSTIKRFFGLISTRFNPSKYTLDTFAVFLGFINWKNYRESYKGSTDKANGDLSWETLQKQLQIITGLSMSSLRERTGYDPEKMVFRTFTKKIIPKFRQSDKTVMMVVAPDGYGKSTLLIQLANEYFLKENARFSNDIIALIDGSIFFNLYAKNPNNELLNQLIDFKINTGFYQYFRQYPEKRKRKIWMIIDNVDEIFSDRERYQQFAENLTRIIMTGDNDWIKIVLTCRPENLDIFTWLMQKSPFLKTYWFNPESIGAILNGAVNVPLFSRKEIEKALELKQVGYDYSYLETHHKEVLRIIRHPYLLTLFAGEFNHQGEISEITLLKRYIVRRLNTPPYLEEKREIINKFIDLCKRGRETSSVRKDRLFAKINHPSAYRELIAYGILYEYIIPGETLDISKFVKFRQNIIFEYLLFEKWRHNKPMTTTLFFKISEFYKNNQILQCNLLKFFIRFLILEKKYETIKQIHTQFETKSKSFSKEREMPPCLCTLSAVIKESLQSDPQLRENLVTWLQSTKIGKSLYTEG